MRFLPNGPEIPKDLIAAQEKGQTIFVCGAGVSMTVGVPGFKGLVQDVYDRLREDWSLHHAESEVMRVGGRLAGQFDRVLRSLERRLAANNVSRASGMRARVRSAVRQALAPPDNVDFSNHYALLKLSRDTEGRIRLITTNFETLFERAWFQKHGTSIASYAGAAMPQPKVAGCEGVLHLHGRLADSWNGLELTETDFVLTSAEFGEAYLRSGWASRYVYDLARAYTVVLVGYGADDPPMRYLLEVLEADRERYPDLQKVYAFASCKDGDEELEAALWRAKGVEPILYRTIDHDHRLLYDSLQEWCRYAGDPSAWRRNKLTTFFQQPHSTVSDSSWDDCLELLSHGDVSQQLGHILPAADWLPLLVARRVFAGENSPAQWISGRLADPAMIDACAGLHSFDDRTRLHIEHELHRQVGTLSIARRKAWSLMLAAKSRSNVDRGAPWYRRAKHIKDGDFGFEARHLVTRVLRPRLEVKKVLRWRSEAGDRTEPETLDSLIDIDFEWSKHPAPEEILNAWPQSPVAEIALIRALHRALLDALEEAQDCGFLDHFDRSSNDVPSIGQHQQNTYRGGFYPIVRVIADLWERLAARQPVEARAIAMEWIRSQFLLMKRLWIFAIANQVITPTEVAAAILDLDERTFWASGAQVEIMRAVTTRWAELDGDSRTAIEARIRGGIARDLFPTGAFDKKDEWISIRDSSIFKRLKRIEAAGGALSAESAATLAEIVERHPQWQASAADRDDFHSWHESRSGPSGHPDLLAHIPDERLVEEALRLQRERSFDEGDIWRMFCSADPDRALNGLRHAAGNSQIDIKAWRDLLWAAASIDGTEFQRSLAELVEELPRDPLRELLPALVSWLQQRRQILSALPGGQRFLRIWDICADIAYAPDAAEAGDEDRDDRLTEALNRPGGMLAWALVDAFSDLGPQVGAGLDGELAPRFNKAVNAGGRAGLLARVYFARFLAFFDTVAPDWTAEHLTPRMAVDQPDAAALWQSYAQDKIGTARLFNQLKPTMLRLIEQRETPDHVLEGITAKLLSVAIWRQRGDQEDYNLQFPELRRALTLGPPRMRDNVSHQIWRMMAADDGAMGDRSARWRLVFGPLLAAIWPLDAELRSERTSQNLVLMALECEAAFPEAVEAIADLLVPYQVYGLAHALRLERHHDQLVRQHPLASVRLANAIIDPESYAVPDDLGTFLGECMAANPAIEADPAYVRLRGLSRLAGA